MQSILKSTKLLIATLTAVALVLRLYKLGTYSLWFDEVCYVLGAQNLFNPDTLTVHVMSQLPVSLLLKVWSLLGSSDWWWRLLPALAGTATVPVIYLMARRFADRLTGVVCAAIMAMNPLDIYYSQTVRRDSIWILVVTVSLYYFGRAIQSMRTRDMVSYVAWSAFSVMIMPFGLIVYGAFGLVSLIEAWKLKSRLKAWLLANVSIGVLGLFRFLTTWYLYDKGYREPVGSDLSIITIAGTIKTFLFGHHLPSLLLYPAAVFTVLLILYGLGRQYKKERPLFLLIALSALFMAITITAGAVFEQETLVIRYYVFLLPLLIFQSAYTIRWLPSSFMIGSAAAVLLFFTGLSDCRLYQNTTIDERETHQRQPYLEMSKFILDHKRDGDAIVHFHRTSYFSVNHYTSKYMRNAHLLFDVPECARTNQDNREMSKVMAPLGMTDMYAAEELPKHKRVWMVFSEWQYDKLIYNPAHHLWRRTPPEAALDWLRQHYKQVPFEDGGRMVMRKTFDDKEWLCLYLFDVTQKPR